MVYHAGYRREKILAEIFLNFIQTSLFLIENRVMRDIILSAVCFFYIHKLLFCHAKK